jgi:hypothetical protein
MSPCVTRSVSSQQCAHSSPSTNRIRATSFSPMAGVSPSIRPSRTPTPSASSISAAPRYDSCTQATRATSSGKQVSRGACSYLLIGIATQLLVTWCGGFPGPGSGQPQRWTMAMASPRPQCTSTLVRPSSRATMPAVCRQRRKGEEMIRVGRHPCASIACACSPGAVKSHIGVSYGRARRSACRDDGTGRKVCCQSPSSNRTAGDVARPPSV